MKRIVDILVSLFGLIVASPLMILIAALIKFESKGPVFYACRRVGRHGRPFGMLKFRTMVENADRVDCKLCAGGDVRITDFGRFLRRTKLNELPQLFNVLMGEMSIVGPRPEDPKFVHYYKKKWNVVLSVRPGIFGPNQLFNRNEEDLFPVGVDHEAFYVENILPEKLERDIAYAKDHSLIGDVALVLKGVHATLFRGISLRDVVIEPKTLRFFIWDLALSGLAYVLANYLKYEELPFQGSILISLAFLLVANPILFFLAGLYKRRVRFFSFPDLIHVAKISLLSLGLLMVFNYFFMIGTGFSRLVYVVYPIILTMLLAAKRMVGRLIMERREILLEKNPHPCPTLIYGAGRKGAGLLKRLKFEPEYDVLGFIDDDTEKKNQSVMGVKILGTGLDLKFLKSLHGIEKVFVAFEPTKPTEMDRVRKLIADAGIADIMVETSAFEFVGDTLIQRNLFRTLQFTDTIGMKDVSVDLHSLHAKLAGSTVAIVGAGDPVGEELCSGLMALGVKGLVIIEDCEARLRRINQFIRANGKDKVNHQSYFVPMGTLPFVEKRLAEHDIKWLIYNGLNRRIVEEAITFPAQYVLRLTAAVQFIKLADRIGCDAFTFVSPLGKSGLSVQERELAILLESFFSYWTTQPPSQLRVATVRPATVIEDPNEIFLQLCQILSREQSIQVPQKSIRLTSAKNAARFFINSYPLHNSGAVYIEGSTTICDLKTLLAKFLQFCGDKAGKTSLIGSLTESEAAWFVGGPEGLADCEMTPITSILKLKRPDQSYPALVKDLEKLHDLYELVRNNGGDEHFSEFIARFASETEEALRAMSTRQ